MVRRLVNQHSSLAIALMDRLRPVSRHGESKSAEVSTPVATVLHMPGPAAFAVPVGGQSVEVTRAPVIAVTGDQHRSLQHPFRCRLLLHLVIVLHLVD